MPLYEGRHNVENKITISDTAKNSIVFGAQDSLRTLARRIAAGEARRVALDGWYGVDFKQISQTLRRMLQDEGKSVEWINVNSVFYDEETVRTYKQRYITDDPGFGCVNLKGRVADLMDPGKVETLKKRVETAQTAVVYGYGAAAPALFDSYDTTVYFDKTRQPLLWEMWDGKLIPFAKDEVDSGYQWKEYYYCDYYLLHFQKHFLLDKMDYYAEAVDFEGMKLMPRATYDEIVTTMLTYPVKEVEIYQPGPWGAYRYRDFWEIEGLECNAWNELAGPELSILIDVGAKEMINMPFVNLMQYADELVGSYLNQHYPHLFPLDVWLDDGYFPQKTPAERISMPIHNHPSTDYVKRHFNEPIGRYETYYIAEAYEGANTWMGFTNEADLEEWERKCRESGNQKEIGDWKDYVCNWTSNVGDLYLIPPGTDHAHGGNQMVLEMDTCPSISGTEYSFFSYDFARNSWDDTTKTMTGPPVKMHLEHSFDNSKWRREDYVDKKLRARPEVVKWEKEYYIDRYTSVPEMPFEIERIHYYRQGENDTQGRFAHVLTLTVGERAVIRSKAHPERCAQINLFQSVVIPAAFGAYELLNPTGGQNTVVLLRWKKG